jgi:hypothetical protein
MKSLRAIAIPVVLAVAVFFAAPRVASAGGFHGGGHSHGGGGHFHGGAGHFHGGGGHFHGGGGFHGGFHSHVAVGFGIASPYYYGPSVVVGAPYPTYPYYPYPAPYAYGYSAYAGYPYASYPYGYGYYGAPFASFSVHAHVPVPHFHGGGHGHGGFHGHIAVHPH